MNSIYANVGRQFRHAIDASTRQQGSLNQKNRLALLRDICIPTAVRLRPLEDVVSSQLFAALSRAANSRMNTILTRKEILVEASAIYREEILISLGSFLDGFTDGDTTLIESIDPEDGERKILRMEELGTWLGSHVPDQQIEVYGLISSIKAHKGHIWLELRDTQTGHSLQCVIWQSHVDRIGIPEDDIDVSIKGRFNFWPYRYSLCFQITEWRRM
jgi:hypothetical protein